jgi:hypothetical protein
MRKISLIISTAALSLLNSGARAATDDLGAWASQPLFAPHPALVAILALAGMGFLVLLARAPIASSQSSRRARSWTWPSLPIFWPSQRAFLALMAMIAVTGSMGLA